MARGEKATSREWRYAAGYRPPRMRLGAGQRRGGAGWQAAAGLDRLEVARGGKGYLEGVVSRAGLSPGAGDASARSAGKSGWKASGAGWRAAEDPDWLEVARGRKRHF